MAIFVELTEGRSRRLPCGCLAIVLGFALLAVFWPIVLGGAIFALATLQVLLERLVN